MPAHNDAQAPAVMVQAETSDGANFLLRPTFFESPMPRGVQGCLVGLFIRLFLLKQVSSQKEKACLFKKEMDLQKPGGVIKKKEAIYKKTGNIIFKKEGCL